MAKLIFEDGREATAADLTSLATAHGIVVEHREVPAELAPLLQRPLLDDDATFSPRCHCAPSFRHAISWCCIRNARTTSSSPPNSKTGTAMPARDSPHPRRRRRVRCHR